MPQISMTNLRKNFDEIVERVAAGEAFIITKWGKPHCRFAPVDDQILAELASAQLQKSSLRQVELSAFFNSAAIMK